MDAVMDAVMDAEVMDAAVVPAAGVRRRLTELVRRAMGSVAGAIDPFPIDKRLSDLGVSSLKLLNLMLAVESEFDIAIPQSEITHDSFHSVSSMETLVRRVLLKAARN